MEGFHGAPRRRNVAFRRGRERSSNRLRNDLRNSASFVRSFVRSPISFSNVKSKIDDLIIDVNKPDKMKRERKRGHPLIGSIFFLINENWESVKSGRITLTGRRDNNFVFLFFAVQNAFTK